MKKHIKLSTFIVATFAVLVACNNDEPSASEETTREVNDEMNEMDETDSDESEAMADEEFNDQLDLRIGDTGTVESTTGLYEITLNGVEVIQEVDGQMSELDEFMIAEFTIRNIGEEAIDALDTIGNFELTDAPEAAGMTDMAEHFEGVDAFDGNINPGEQATAQTLYYTFDADEYYVLVTEGLVGTGAVKNKITFTFEKSEAE